MRWRAAKRSPAFPFHYLPSVPLRLSLSLSLSLSLFSRCYSSPQSEWVRVCEGAWWVSEGWEVLGEAWWGRSMGVVARCSFSLFCRVLWGQVHGVPFIILISLFGLCCVVSMTVGCGCYFRFQVRAVVAASLFIVFHFIMKIWFGLYKLYNITLMFV